MCNSVGFFFFFWVKTLLESANCLCHWEEIAGFFLYETRRCRPLFLMPEVHCPAYCEKSPRAEKVNQRWQSRVFSESCRRLSLRPGATACILLPAAWD